MRSKNNSRSEIYQNGDINFPYLSVGCSFCRQSRDPNHNTVSQDFLLKSCDKRQNITSYKAAKVLY